MVGSSVFRFVHIVGNDAGKALMTLLGILANTNHEEVSYRSMHDTMSAEDTSIDASTELIMVGEASRRTPIFEPEYLDSIPALPHTSKDKLFVMDLQALQGDRKNRNISLTKGCVKKHHFPGRV